MAIEDFGGIGDIHVANKIRELIKLTVVSDDFDEVKRVTQAQYDAIAVKSDRVLYVVVG